MSNPGSINNSVLPCQNLDVEVVSDIIEDLDDIEVTAQPKDNPDPDIDVRAILETASPPASTAASANNTTLTEPDYDVDVSCKVIDAEEPDLVLTCSITNNSNEAAGGPRNG